MNYHVETWDPFDERLPKDEDIMRPRPDPVFLESFKEVQLEPIAVGIDMNTKEYFYIFGSKRILAARILTRSGEIDRGINVGVFEGVTSDMALRLRALENSQRSMNEIELFMSIQDGLLNRKQTYAQLAKALGSPVGTIKSIEKKWYNVPDWAVQGALGGKMSLSTAIAVGRIKKSDQLAVIKQKFDDVGRLSQSEVQELRRVVQSQEYKEFFQATESSEPVKDWFERSILETILKLLKDGSYAEAEEYIQDELQKG